MSITSAKYVKHYKTNKNDSITIVKSGIKWSVPLDENNTNYQEIQEWVKEGNTIEEAD